MFLVIFLAGRTNYLLMPTQDLLKLIFKGDEFLLNWGFVV